MATTSRGVATGPQTCPWVWPFLLLLLLHCVCDVSVEGEGGREGGERERERGSEYERGGEGGMYWIHSPPGQDCVQ